MTAAQTIDRASTFLSLAEKVEAWAGGDQHWKLNAEIWTALGWNETYGGWIAPGGAIEHHGERPSLLHSLNAVKELEWPEWKTVVYTSAKDAIATNGMGEMGRAIGKDNEPRARLAAVLRTLATTNA